MATTVEEKVFTCVNCNLQFTLLPNGFTKIQDVQSLSQMRRHVPARGYDVGTCDPRLIPIFEELNQLKGG